MPMPPSRIEDFVQQLSYCLFPTDMPAPLGCHYHFEHGCWEVALFPSLLQSSDNDGFSTQRKASAFSFDIQQALPMFEELHHLDWVSVPFSDENEVGPHLLIEGVVNDELLLIRVCADVPNRFRHEPDLIIQEREMR